MKNLSSEQGETVSLQAFTNNHPQTRFQWYHMEDGNWTEIPDQVSESYIIPIVLLIDSGQYRCRITNDWVSRLTQYSAPITLEVTENPNNEGELSDSLEIEALTAFYNATKGGSWNSNTNWLQGTTVDEVANWHGITIENGDVATIQLANNNLSGSLPLKINDLLGLTQLDIRNNAFSVNAIANYFTGPDTYPVDELLYQPQAEVIGQSTTLDVSAGDPVVLRAFTNNHPQTRFQWFRNEEGAWVEIVGQTNESLTLASVTTAEAGQYRCQITNEWVSGLKQYSAPITLNVEEPIAIDEGLVPDSLEYAALVAIYYATQGEEWLHNDNWLQGSTSADFDTWWGVEVTDGDIDSLILSGNNLNGSIPADIDDLTQLAALTLSDNNIPGISAEIARLVNLTYLDLHAVGLDNLPNAVSNLSSLKSLNLAENNLTQLPGGIKNLSLEQLDVSSNELATLPNFNDHPTLNDLIVSANRISVNDIAFNRDGPGVADHDFTSFGYTPQAEVIGSPRNQFVVEGQNISLQAFTNNHPQSRFQWYRQQGNTWTALSGQTQATYTITSVTTDHAGQYRCQITNNWVDGITQYSAPITLEITNGPYYSVASGLWTDAIWALEPGGAPVGTYPQAYSEAYIVGHDVTVNQPLTTGSVHVVVDRAPSSLTVDGAEMVIRGQLDLTKKTEGFPGNVKVVNDGRIVPLQP